MLAAGAACLLAALGAATPASADPPKKAGSGAEFSDTAARQIAALQKIKQSQSKADSKVDSVLTVERKTRSDRALNSSLPGLHTGVAVSDKGTVLVDIRADKVSDDLVGAIRKAGGGIRAVSPANRTVRAEVPLASVEQLAGRGDVRRVETASEAWTERVTDPKAPPAKPESKEAKAARISAMAKQAITKLTSEGDQAHAAADARQNFHVTGVGVKLCALSDGVDSLAAMQSGGVLPAVDVLPTQEGSGDEGTAMLQILHDLAPGASLGFATAFNGDASFADNIRALRTQSRCDVIVDDVLYFNESPFQDGLIAKAVNDVTAAGALYFSSAGNEGSVGAGTSGHWEGDFVDSGKGVGKFAGTAHNFAGSAGTQIYDPLSAGSANKPVTLFWSDPLGASGNDYDLYLLNSAGTVVAFSQNIQDGTQDPYERLNTTFDAGLRLAVVKFKGDNRYLSLDVLRGRFADSTDGLKKYATPGVTRGHSAAKDAFSVAAAPAAGPLPFSLEPGDPPNPTGPYPGRFGANTQLERFSSDGPRRVFFNADGTPLTPGNVSASGGQVRQKPDLTAADGTQSNVPGFSPFFGTSAAAPHAAAIAGLVLSGNPGLSPADVRDALTKTAIPLGDPGRAGAGVLLATDVLAYTGASPQPLALPQRPTVTDNSGSPYLLPGSTATVSLPVHNGGDGTAVSTSVVLSSPTPGVTIAPRSKGYGTIEPGQTGVNTFTITVPASQELGAPVQLVAKVSFAGSLSPKTGSFDFPVGKPSTDVKTFAYAGAAVAIPDNDPTGATVTVPVSNLGRASGVSVSVDGTVCSTTAQSTTVGIDHTWVGDLVGTVTSPSGQTAVLFQRNGSSGHNVCQAVFDDSAGTPFSSVTSSLAPFTGKWRPAKPLGALVGQPADGNWTIKVVDAAAGDTGSIRAVSLRLTGYVAG
ncbi:S8 family serine peptidase [Solihabitans fulvus]|uniref:S8 family serine peptidase n=1 Tax=Solihabitans fulvus TaxID=1892852 RepID=A0A5B2XFR1_9PSEU|nr:S8 family serine peptidase [Solihabitans fulvus]